MAYAKTKEPKARAWNQRKKDIQWILTCRVRTRPTAKWKSTPVRSTTHGLGPWVSEPAALLHAAQFRDILDPQGGYRGARGGGRKRAALQTGTAAAEPKRTRSAAREVG